MTRAPAQGMAAGGALPVCHDPAARDLARVGVIDVGSNSVRLVVFDGAARSPVTFYNEKVMCGLGTGMASGSDRLCPEGRVRALAALGRFAALIEGMGLPAPLAVATAAVRNAADGPDFVAEVARETGLRLRVIPGEEEARLSAQGVLMAWPQAEGLVCDIGGSSMELARIGGGRVQACATSDLGPLRLMALADGAERGAAIARGVARLHDRIGADRRLFLVGGSWRALARLDMARRAYPLHVLQDYRMSPEALRATLDWLAGQDAGALRRAVGLSNARMALVPQAGEVLAALLERFGIAEAVTSAFGLREGVLYDQMPAHLRQRDPLIEAAHHAEAQGARMPGFGLTLHRFVAPLLAGSNTPQRWVQAACLMHDICWRAHPDYRAEQAFESAALGNFGGVDHLGRIYIGLALHHRYRGGKPAGQFQPMLAMMPPEQQREAEVLGRAMRFGAMFSLANPRRMGSLHRAGGQLVLRLPPDARVLYGEVAAARFEALARALGCTPVLAPL